MIQPDRDKKKAATRGDSIAVYNSQFRLNNFYNEEVKKGRIEKKREFTSFTNTRTTEDIAKLKKDNSLFYKGLIKYRKEKGKGKDDKQYEQYYGTSAENIASLEKEGLKTATLGGPNKAYYRDIITPQQNLKAPYALVDSRIDSQGVEYYNPTSSSKDNRYPGNAVGINKYDLLAVKPFDLLTAKEKTQRVEKYGRSGVPDSYNPENEDSNSSNSSAASTAYNVNPPIKRRQIQSIPPLTPKGIKDTNSISSTSTPIVRNEAKIPKSYNIQENNTRMNGAGGYGDGRNVNTTNADVAVRAVESADRYNAYVDRKYNNSTNQNNVKAQERAKTLKNKVKVTPVYAYGGRITTINTTMKRLPANKRHIAPMLIGAGVSALSTGIGMFSQMSAAKEAEEAKKRQLQQMYNNKFTTDAQYMEDYNVNGDIGTDYYAKGGKLSTSSTKGNLNATGGDLIPLNSNTQVAEGNTHGEKTIDGQYGITLDNGQESIAEIEDKEVLVDGEMVFSERLKYNKGVSYADKAKQIANKAGKLEKRLDGSTDKRERNSIERQLAGTTMANRALFADQEATQIREGKVELDKMPWGGKLNPYGQLDANGNKKYSTQLDDPAKPIRNEPYNEFANYGKSGYGEFEEPMGPFSTSSNLATNMQIDKTSSPIDTNGLTNGSKAKLGGDDIQDPSFMGDLAPSLIDNAGNLLLTAMTPKLPKPIGKIAPRMETRVNTNPQLSAIANADNTVANTITSNTNNSVVARSAVTASRLRGRNARLGVMAEKENAEMGLRNQRNQQVASVNNANIDTANQHNNDQFTRQNDIQSRLSGNLADAAEDIKGTTDNRNMASRDEQIMMLDMLDDPTGVKAKMMRRNGYYKGSRKFRKLLDQETKRKNG